MHQHLTEIIAIAEKDISSIWAQRFQHFIIAKPEATDDQVLDALLPKVIYNVLAKEYKKDGAFRPFVHGIHARLIGGKGNDVVFEVDLAIETPVADFYHVVRGVKVRNAAVPGDPGEQTVAAFFDAEQAEEIEAMLIESSKDSSFITGPATVQ